MSTFQRIGFAFGSTVALAIAGTIYQRVFANALLPLVDPEGTFSTPVMWLDNLVPVIIVMLLLAVWVWVVFGAVQDEKAVDRRRVRR